jgi:hypothetical protein
MKNLYLKIRNDNPKSEFDKLGLYTKSLHIIKIQVW